MTSLSASFTLNDRFTGVLNKINSGLKKATGNMQEFKDKISGPAKAFQSLGNAAAAGINKLNSSIKSKMSTASNVVKSSTGFHFIFLSVPLEQLYNSTPYSKCQ